MLKFWLDWIFLGFESAPFCCLLLFLLPTFLERDVGGSELPGAKGQAGQRPRCLSVS